MNVPSLDLLDFTEGSYADRATFVEQLGSAFVHIGFVSIQHHGLSDQLINHLYDQSTQFFSLSRTIKGKYEIKDLFGQRGYTSFGREHAKGSTNPDLKEFFQFGQFSSGQEVYPANIQVQELPLFHDTFKSAFFLFEKTGIQLLQAIATYLDLPETFFDERVTHGNSILRAIHYPPILHEPASSIRAEHHEDINLITLLVGASADGLEILSKDNQWIPVQSKPNEIIVNVGDMLQRLTNDKLKSTTHRVVNPPRSQWHTSRYSIPFFLHPVSHMSLQCLDNCIDDMNPKRYVDITAGAYLDERLKEIGLKK